ncbi:hypothetical protein SBOR_7192 [Sclerotinia borealis F-4128]|uniref:Uncharacterized protein n=1 Tax=Sclerotinia borealis (strain F-4128) TaxID=1432307 RepID=W9C9G4_SCLBF|nr:hypothetical protein SBOR_7192 [Sclerotinia borealis F-4128]
MPGYSSAKQVQEWEDLKFYRKTHSEQLYLITGQPQSPEHDRWLRKQETLGKNDQRESPDVGSPEPNDQTNERTKSFLTELEISRVPLEAGNISPQPQHRRLPARGVKDPARPFSQEESQPQNSIRHITMLPPTCYTYGLLAMINADIDQSYVSKAIISRMKLERHVKKAECSTHLKIGGKELSTDEIIQIRWCNEGSRTTTKTEFYVAPPGFFDVMFGRDVLNGEKL